MSSACELEYTLLLAKDLGMLKAPAYEALAPKVAEVKRMLASFIKKLIAER
ncbi:MAG: four helix bundle protein [Elusimicrobia bacterium]|nr:four helix bundle protein [Elusimicrobiota bacterium]